MTIKIGIVGLGYVGLPLAVAFASKYPTVGFDIKADRIKELQEGFDQTHEVTAEELSAATSLSLTDNSEDLKSCNFYIVTVPTPIDSHNIPDLRPLQSASQTVGKLLAKNDIVVYESTVYPGVTEDECVPILEAHSGLTFNTDFFCGYSPERINPGDMQHRITDIKKVTSGSTPEIAQKVDAIYRSVITAGTHLAPSIKVAEAAKVIENTQRDLNIALMNELSILFHKLGIQTKDVLAAASTKWNFLPFRPGLVGGHCIGVDPYYLTYKATSVGHTPEIILAGRRINDNMSHFIASQFIKLLIKNGQRVQGAKILVLGIAFKENCPDTRNSKVVNLVNELEEFGCCIDVYDPWVKEYTFAKPNLKFYQKFSDLSSKYDGLILAVAHREFAPIDLNQFCFANTAVFDIAGAITSCKVDDGL